ncbi:hypothetical protein ACTAQJ_19630 [Arthrobacter sp. alpha11c]
MIIQAGFDIQVLARPYIVPNEIPLSRLVVIGLNSDMCLTSIGIASYQFDGSLEPLFDDIFEVLTTEGIKYFAIAYGGCWQHFDFESAEPSPAETEKLRRLAIARGLLMIGNYGIDESRATAVELHSFFDQHRRDLPETMLHWRHSSLSKYPECHWWQDFVKRYGHLLNSNGN